VRVLAAAEQAIVVAETGQLAFPQTAPQTANEENLLAISEIDAGNPVDQPLEKSEFLVGDRRVLHQYLAKRVLRGGWVACLADSLILLWRAPIAGLRALLAKAGAGRAGQRQCSSMTGFVASTCASAWPLSGHGTSASALLFDK
jgi:hypothetical protein